MTGRLALAVRLARRELRGGLAGFRVFLLCLALGVAAIAAVGTVRAAIQAGLREQGVTLLGGDAQVELTYRFATPAERAAMEAAANRLSEVVDFRSMAVAGEERTLVQVKGVDGAYPLVGEAPLDPAMPLAEALVSRDGLPGAVMEPALAARLGLSPGGDFTLGTQVFRLTALLLREPDAATGGLALAPRVIVRTADLARSGLIRPGTLYETAYRLDLPPGEDLSATRDRLMAALPESGARWSDSRRPAPGVARFVNRTGDFLVLVGLAGMAVGGVGISAAVRAWLGRKTATIATLKVLGAETGLVFRVYLAQVAVLSLAGVLAGLALGAGLPLIFAPAIEAALPFPLDLSLYPRPLAEAAFYGGMTALVFSLWPLAQAARLGAATLYRGAEAAIWPGRGASLALAAAVALLIGGAVALSGAPGLAAMALAGIAAALAVLVLAAAGIRRLARRLSRTPVFRGRVSLRAALAAVGAQGAETRAVVLSLGLGLTVLAAVGQIDANLRLAISRDLPDRAPSFFFLDIQKDQIDPFLARVQGDRAVSKVESAPMLRGIIAQINGRPAREVAGNHWVLNGDRGVTYSAALPENTRITAGKWWPEDYAGPPLVSFSATEAGELGLKIGDRITVNILGRDIEAEIASFRAVDFRTAGMGFTLAMDPHTLAPAPHTWIATVYAEPQAEAALLRDIGRTFPNVTAVSVKEAIARVAEAMGQIATATSLAAIAVLATGFVVLTGAAAAGQPARIYEAAVLKVLGATRARILWSFALRAALTGAAAGAVAVLAGAAGAWAVMRFVMEVPFVFAVGSALAVIGGGILAVLLAGLAFALGSLRLPPARVLRGGE